MSSVIIGPGLGRSAENLAVVEAIIAETVRLNLPLVCDADSLFVLKRKRELISGYENCILTPNRAELARFLDADFSVDVKVQTRELAKSLGNVTVLAKGEQDIITNGDKVVVVNNEGSMRRCGGQGDVLAGILGTFAFWVSNTEVHSPEDLPNMMWAAQAGSFLTRQCSRKAYEAHRRAMTARSLIDQIGPELEVLLHGVEQKQ